MKLPSLRFRPLTWLALACFFHLLIALGVFIIGHHQLAPTIIDSHGVGLRFSSDALAYRSITIDLAETLRHDGLLKWVRFAAPLHCRMYSLAFSAVGGVVGYNTLAAEPLNLLYYAAILTAVYQLGHGLFDRRAAFISTAIVALWPSFVIHSVQIIKDPLAIAALLWILLVITLLLTRTVSSIQAAAWTISGAWLVIIVWLVRPSLWISLVTMIALAAVLLMIRMLQTQSLAPPNVMVLTSLAIVTFFVPGHLREATLPVDVERLATIAGARSGVQNTRHAASDIDPDVRLHSVPEVLKFLPRAVVIGLFAPFPNMWLRAVGQAGVAARYL
ncbi:MAG: hypothetical protein ABR555_12745, partial [Pyrinomonadaceae bacterium]